MRSVHFMLAVPVGIAGAIFLSGAQVLAENIYHWKNQNGVSCFSNTNIPGGAAELSVMFVNWPATEKSASFDPDGAAQENIDTADAAHAEDGPGEVFDSKAAFLRDRIAQRRSSIQRIEKLLRIHSDDAGLRKQLARKKRYLHEDLIHLGLLAK